MATNVLFKRGSYKNLPAAGYAVDGAIYLTEDEGGIYLGLADKTLKRMGDYVFVQDLAALKEYATSKISKYTMFYVIEGNILAFYDPDAIDPVSGQKGVIRQINKQKELNELIDAIDLAVSADGTIDIALTLGGETVAETDSVKLTGAGATVVSGNANNNEITITSEDHVAKLGTKSNKIQLSNTTADGKSAQNGVVGFVGEGELAASFRSVDGENNIYVDIPAPSVATSVATANAETTATIGLYDTAGNYLNDKTSSIKFKGAGNATVTSDDNQTITISGDDTVASLSVVKNSEKTAIVLKNAKNGGTATDAGEVKFDTAGNLMPTIDYSNGALVVTVDGADTTAATFDAEGNLSVTQLKNGDAIGESLSVKPVIEYGMGATKQTAVFADGKATLNVPTISEVEDLLKGLDAMTFRGVKSAADVNKITTALKGDTYKINVEGPVGGVNVGVGDLVINNGEDDQTPVWQVVPAGDEVVNTYEFVAADGSISLLESPSKDTKGVIYEGNLIEITNTDGATAQISHAALNPTEGENKEAGAISLIGDVATSFTAISGLVQDTYGHVTTRTIGTYTISPLATLSSSFAVEGNTATMTLGLADVDNNYITAEQDITSETLAMSAAEDGTLSIDLQWGSF